MLFVILIWYGSAVAGPQVPGPDDVQRYERDAPVFSSTAIAKGAELLDALKGGEALKPWLQDSPLAKEVVCVLPVPARWWVTVHRKDGSTYKLGFSSDGGLVYLPEGLYETDAATRAVLGKLLAELEEDLKQELANQEKPCKYRVGTASDGGTLSGIARLFYRGDAPKWRAIFETNSDVIKDPNVINSGMLLTIPADP